MKNALKDKWTEVFTLLVLSLRSINWSTISSKTLRELERGLGELPDHQKAELVAWISAVQTIKADSTLKRVDTVRKLESLDTSEFIFNLLRATITTLVNSIPIENKLPFHLAANGAVGALALLNFEWAGLAFFALKKGLPSLLLADQADPLLAFLKRALSEPETKAEICQN